MQTTISEGTYSGIQFRLTTPDPITVGSTSLSFVDGSGVPGGANKQLQYNNSGALDGASVLEYILAKTTLISTGNVISSANLISTKFRAGELIWNANGSPIISDVPDPSVYLGIKTITTSTTLIDTVPIAGNVGFRWTVTAKDTVNSRFRYGILDSVNDGTSVYYNEYSKIFSDPAYPVGTFTSNITSGNINLWGVGDSAGVQVTFQRLALGSLTVEGYTKQKMAVGPKGEVTGTAGVINTSNITPATSSASGALVVSGGAGVAGNIYAGENIVATGNITSVGTITAGGNLTVLGSLIVQGDVTTLNTATLEVEDLNITVAKGAASAAAANGAGLTVATAGAALTYTSSTDRWSMNKSLAVNTTYLTDLPRWTANSNPVRTGKTFTSSATPPPAPFDGDQWYDTSDDTLYEWINDGATSYWVDIQTTAITANANAASGPAFSVYCDSGVTQTITSGSQQKVLFQLEEYDTHACFASSRFTPVVAGYYQLNATVRFSGAVGTGECMIVVYKNGAEYKRGWNSSGVQWASTFWSMSVNTQVYANGTTDYFEVYVQQTSGSSLTITVAGSAITYFNGGMIRPA
jgi:hypothetical protein